MARQTVILFGKQTVTSFSCKQQTCSMLHMGFAQAVTTVWPRIWTASRPSSPLLATQMARRSMQKSSRRTGEVSCHAKARICGRCILHAACICGTNMLFLVNSQGPEQGAEPTFVPDLRSKPCLETCFRPCVPDLFNSGCHPLVHAGAGGIRVFLCFANCVCKQACSSNNGSRAWCLLPNLQLFGFSCAKHAVLCRRVAFQTSKPAAQLFQTPFQTCSRRSGTISPPRFMLGTDVSTRVHPCDFRRW